MLKIICAVHFKKTPEMKKIDVIITKDGTHKTYRCPLCFNEVFVVE